MRGVPLPLILALACVPLAAGSRGVFAFVQKKCSACHNRSTKAGDLDLTSLKAANTFESDRDTWELVVEKLKLGQMPPAGVPHPPAEATAAITIWLENEFARQDALLKPQAGRVAARRLNRAEYNTTIRDLLGVDIRPADNFPADNAAFGFDNNSGKRERGAEPSEHGAAVEVFAVDDYLADIREVEARIQASEKDPLTPPSEKPSGIPFEYRDYVKLMFDLQAIAFQSDLTRVSTMMLGREGSVRTYPEIGVPDPHHPLTHHRGHPDFIEKVTKINCYHVELFAVFLARLKATPDGDGTLLDHSAIVYGGALSDGNVHFSSDLPLLVAGRSGGLKGGRHVASEDGTPVSNLFVRLMSSVGLATEKFADSTGRVDC